ncbi:hypothetical protein ACIQAC_19075 [Streptomyces sp. NPDC088387]|uniref:hypothetical protein n=1 Tax=Streptomyces sp. NPDC088387 TaxID=3365859 RepID=UPI0037FE5136
MARTTPSRPLDLAAVFPELAATARPVTRLHPRSGAPTAGDSSVGGPLLWPRDEAWPMCTKTHEVYEVVEFAAVRAAHHLSVARWSRPDDRRPTAEEEEVFERARPKEFGDLYTAPVPLLPVAQLYARDVPGLPCPDGTDLLQILWCPFMDHHDDIPAVQLHWRAADEVTDVLAAPPEPDVIELEEYWPAPCVLYPEQVVEHPGLSQLPADLGARVCAWQEETGHYYNAFSGAPGWKTGGWGAPEWREETPTEPVRCTCGAVALPLFTLGGAEWHGNDEGAWRTVEDADDRRCYPPVGDPTNVRLGDEKLQILRCPGHADHPPVVARVY